MIILIIVLSIIYIALITFIAKTYYKNIQDLEDRVLQLEKRLVDCNKNTSKEIDIVWERILEINEFINEHEKRIQKQERHKNTKEK